ncbi:MAG: sugar ABC transporter permease [Lachnospiraceae bacterium]|nr:sugar ABC transporter permease [Lachnospiraceae bacterium]
MKLKALWKNTVKHKGLLLLALPGVVIMFMFNYVPLFGLTLAFKKLDFSLGIFESPWCGLDNFRIFITSKRVIWRLLRNTIGYWALFTSIGMICNVGLALALNECRGKRFKKYAHTIMIAPTFMSWVAITFIVKALLNESSGLINSLLETFGVDTVAWYSSPDKWPVILTLVNIWKSTGYGAIIYLSAISGMDESLYEAAEIDGATRWQCMTKITLPLLVPLITVMLLMSLGGIMSSNTGLFYQVTCNVGILYPTTQTIDTYILNALTSGNSDYGMTSAVTFLQSVVGCITVISANALVRRYNNENALY